MHDKSIDKFFEKIEDDLSGCIITIDAMGTQKKIAQVIMTQNNDYILALKGNHKTLYDDTSRFLKT